MALIRVDFVCDTLIEFIEDQRPVYETIIDRYYQGRTLNIFLGRRKTIPASSIPSIEIIPSGETLGWHACRVQQEEPSIEVEITTDNNSPELSVRLESQLISLTTRIFSIPPHLRAMIKGTRTHLYDSLPGDVRYSTAMEGRLRVATISWKGKSLEYLSNKLFDPIQIKDPLAFPIV